MLRLREMHNMRIKIFGTGYLWGQVYTYFLRNNNNRGPGFGVFFLITAFQEGFFFLIFDYVNREKKRLHIEPKNHKYFRKRITFQVQLECYGYYRLKNAKVKMLLLYFDRMDCLAMHSVCRVFCT